MGKPRGTNYFSDKLQKEFTFIKKLKTSDQDTSEVVCTICLSKFSIANGGRSKITQHVDTVVHKQALRLRSQNRNISSLCGAIVNDGDLEIAAKEAVFSYHIIQHDQSFRSMDCTSKLIKQFFEKKYSSARTKSEAIAVNVLVPLSEIELTAQLEICNFISVSFDSSNHTDKKLFPIQVRYFIPYKGVQTKILDLHSIPGNSELKNLTLFSL
jgi:hypothetical protein